MPRRPTTHNARAVAERLRHEATKWERVLWGRLRLLKAEGFHFRRQCPIGNHVADFACLAHRLVIEIDGEHHDAPTSQIADQARDREFGSLGYTVLRFRNADVTANLDAVCASILKWLNDRKQQ